MTSLDIVNQQFKRSLRGYDAAEVDEFLDKVAETLQIFKQKITDLEHELSDKEKALSEYENMKEDLHEALLIAQKSASDRIKGAKDQAAKMISDAQQKVAEIYNKAKDDEEELCAHIEGIRGLRDAFADEFRSMLNKFDSSLTQTFAASRCEEAVESLLEEPEAAEPETEEYEEEDETPQKDFSKAFDMLGVNPDDLKHKK